MEEMGGLPGATQSVRIYQYISPSMGLASIKIQFPTRRVKDWMCTAGGTVEDGVPIQRVMQNVIGGIRDGVPFGIFVECV